MNTTLDEHYKRTKEAIDNFTIKGSGTGKKKCAIFVMVQDEKIFLPIWLKYYSRYFDGDDIYILDHRTTDGSVEQAAASFKFNLVRLDYPFSFDHKWFQFTAKEMQAKLLSCYEYVIFTDIDEIIIANEKKYSGLDDYINRLDRPYARCTGYELIHMKSKEPDIDPNRAVLAQRKYWYRNKYYDKTLLSSIALNWELGFHETSNTKTFRDRDLLLIHLHKLDYDMCRKKSFERSKLPWKEDDIKNNRGWQNRMTNLKKFNKYYYHWPLFKITTKISKSLRETQIV